MDIKKISTVFIVASFVSILTLTYIGMAYRRSGRPADVPYELFPIFIPLIYGLFGVINYYVITNYGNRYSFLVGMAFGLVLSTIGRFYLNLPVTIFGFTKGNEYTVHIYAIFLYALIFQFVVTPLTNYIVI